MLFVKYNKNKKILRNNTLLIIFLISIVTINTVLITPVLADDEDEETLNEIDLNEVAVESAATTTDEPSINARAAVIYDRTTGKIIWGKKENEKRAMASTTKIMTAIVALENSNLNDVVTISKKAAGTGGSRLKISVGDKITINDLLYGLMLRSRK